MDVRTATKVSDNPNAYNAKERLQAWDVLRYECDKLNQRAKNLEFWLEVPGDSN